MAEPRPIHVVEPDPSLRDRLVRRLNCDGVRSHGSWRGFEEEVGDEEAAVVLGPGVGHEVAWAQARRITDEGRSWVLLRAEEGSEGHLRVRGLSVGFAEGAGKLPSRLAWEETGERPVFELHELLRAVSRARHDLNNPLTAGLAETQLLLMDVSHDETREALETIQRQLRRIQAMIRDDLSRLRPPG